MPWTYVEVAFQQPMRRCFIEVPQYWTQHSVRPISLAGSEHFKQPALAGKFVIINESDELPSCDLHCLVPGAGNVLAWFTAVKNGNMRNYRNFVYGSLCRTLIIVVHNKD